MIFGVGTDIIEVKRVRRAIEKHGKKFLDKIFTLAEQEYCSQHSNPYFRFAGRFAAKEAVVKALGTGFGPLTWLDIEVDNDAYGKPFLKPTSLLQLVLKEREVTISISHCHEYATAVAICFGSK